MSALSEPTRIAWLDLVRAVAILGVLMIHTAGQALGVPPPGGRMDFWWIGNALNALARLSVPLFFMISGALILGKADEPVGVYCKRRLVKIAIPFAAWSLFYLAYRTIFRGQAPVPGDFAELLWKPSYYHLWYFYSITGLYLVAPLLRPFLRATGGQYLVILWVLTIPVFLAIQTFTGLHLDPNFDRVLPIFIGFFVGGYLLKDRLLGPGAARVALLVLLAGWAATAAGNYLLLFKYPVPYKAYFTDYLSVNVVAMSVAAFLLLRKWGEGWGQGNGLGWRLVRLIADGSLGVYVIHPPILELLNAPWFPVHLNAYFIHPLVGIPVTLALALAASLLLVAGLKRIPFVRAVV